LRNRLGEELAVEQPLSATLAFDYPNVQAITDYLAETVLGIDHEAVGTNGGHDKTETQNGGNLVTSMLDNLDSLSDDEIDLILADRASQRR